MLRPHVIVGADHQAAEEPALSVFNEMLIFSKVAGPPLPLVARAMRSEVAENRSATLLQAISEER